VRSAQCAVGSGQCAVGSAQCAVRSAQWADDPPLSLCSCAKNPKCLLRPFSKAQLPIDYVRCDIYLVSDADLESRSIISRNKVIVINPSCAAVSSRPWDVKWPKLDTSTRALAESPSTVWSVSSEAEIIYHGLWVSSLPLNHKGSVHGTSAHNNNSLGGNRRGVCERSRLPGMDAICVQRLLGGTLNPSVLHHLSSSAFLARPDRYQRRVTTEHTQNGY